MGKEKQVFMKTSTLFSLLLATGANCHVLKESDIVPPSGWTKGQRAQGSELLDLTIAVRQNNVDELESVLLQVSDPRSPKYGQHLSLEAVNDLVAPSDESLAAVFDTLAEYQIPVASTSANADFVKAHATVAQAEALLDTVYYEYVHDNGDKVIRADSYGVPDEMAEHVDFVAPTVRLPTVKPAITAVGDDSLGNTPESLRDLYSVGDTEGVSGSGNKLAVASFLEQYVSTTDLEKFYEKYYTPAINRTVTFVGENKPKKPGVESMLDVEYISTLGANIDAEVWYTEGRAPDNPENEPFLDWLFAIGNTTDADVPHLFSVSYGEDEDSVSMDYATRINTEFQKAGARGISLLFASGDSGVGSATGSCTAFAPQWPSGSPWITAVGGTKNSDPEKGAGLSSGGFSNRWEAPSYQTDAIEQWRSSATDLPDSSLYNQTGRGFPDISAQAEGFTVLIDGFPMPGVAGTSAASPTAAGVIALANDLRYQAGKAPLGFLNPFLYQNGDLFTDITDGNNPGCGTKGFYAQEGWDPVTGHGTPSYDKLAAAVEALP